MADANYLSGQDYVVEFLGYRFSFNAMDFEQRVNAAAVKLGLVEPGELDADETADLVELAATGRISEPASGLGEYLVRHWERLALLVANGEVPLPTDLSPADWNALIREVARHRRARLIRYIARAIAADIERARAQEQKSC